ncbi:HDOD domain-containing protein [Chitinibacteraceae bacterium HSL-7]
MQLEALFDQSHKMPTIPRIVQELIESFGKDDVNVSEIAERIALDQVITARLLRIANSVQFGATRRISSANEATIVLGFNTVRTLVVACGVTSAFVATPGLDRATFWHHSLSVAMCARWLAQQSRTAPDTAFTAGLLHNIGELLLHVVEPDLATQINRSVARGGDRSALESTHFGFNAVDVGTELARRWHFPPDILTAIAEQQETICSTDASATLQLALACDGSHPPPTAALDRLHLEADILTKVPDEACQPNSEIEALLG